MHCYCIFSYFTFCEEAGLMQNSPPPKKKKKNEIYN